jgi:purine-binding chemotaxis protein CheW
MGAQIDQMTGSNSEPTSLKHAESRDRGGKYLTFFLGEEEYGLEILKVQEIIGMMPITFVPKAPRFVRGVINLRGKIIPVVDLRLKLGMASKEQTDETCMIVVQTANGHIAVIVDKVSEVLDIANEEIEDPPALGKSVSSDYILGIGKSGGRVKLLLDIDKALSTKDIEYQSISKTAEEEMAQTCDASSPTSTQDEQTNAEMDAAA